MLLPIGANDPKIQKSTAKRQTLVDFLYYGICTGQREMGPIGYSPLPINLVNAGFEQINKLKAADPGVDVTRRDSSTCNNPTFIAGHPERNYLAEIAPFPPECDHRGQGPCTGANGAGGGTGGAGAGGPGAAGAAGGAQVDPDTGRLVPGADAGGASAGPGGSVADADLATRSSGMTAVLAPLAILELLAVLVLPVVLNQRFRRRADRS